MLRSGQIQRQPQGGGSGPNPGLAARTAKQWGPVLVFGRLWEDRGLPELLQALASERKFEFLVARAGQVKVRLGQQHGYLLLFYQVAPVSRTTSRCHRSRLLMGL